MEILEAEKRFLEALVDVDRIRARAILEAVRGEDPPFHAIEALIVPALAKIGTDWEEGAVSLAQVYMSGRICEDLIEEILPSNAGNRIGKPRIAIAVLEDHHLLGKRIVYSALRSAGYRLADYGHGIRAEDLASRALADGVEVLLISVLMLRSALRVRAVTSALRNAGSTMRVVVGGAPFVLDGALWKEVGADAMGSNALDAVAILRRYPEVQP